MITKFKIYESWIGKIFYNNKNDPQKGDYVICDRHLAINSDDILYEVDEFTNSNIGKIVKTEYEMGEMQYYVKFENIPPSIIGEYINPKTPTLMFRRNILDFSKDKEELEQKLIANKYNL